MAFQDRARRLTSKLHLAAVPRPVFLGIIMLIVIVAAVALGATALGGEPAAFEVHSAEGASAEDAAVPEDAADAAIAGEGAATDVVLPAAGGTTAPQLCVHVDGAVLAPGVYYLDAGSRIVDAVDAAGGLTETARTDAVNLARVLQDGEQVVVPDESDVSVAGAAAASDQRDAEPGASGLIDVNRASAAELVALPGVGEATAEKIVADREANGPFKTVEDLKRVSGIGDKKLEALRDMICV